MLDLHLIPRMIDVSCVKAQSTVAEIENMVHTAKHFRFVFLCDSVDFISLRLYGIKHAHNKICKYFTKKFGLFGNEIGYSSKSRVFW